MTTRLRQRLIAALSALLLLLGVIDLAYGQRLNPLLPPAERAAERIALATTGVYVSLRAINAALSTAQEVELGASVGAQASLQPLKVLEPLDDTVERVAGVVFAVAAGAALAIVGLGPVSTLGIFALSAGLAGLWLVERSRRFAGMRRIADASVRVGLALSVVLPLVFAIGVGLGERLTEPSWREAQSRLDRIADQARVLIGGETGKDATTSAPDTEGGSGLFGGLFDRLSDATAAVRDVADSAGRYREAAHALWTEADDLFRASLTLIGIFVLRMVLFPALMLLGAMAILRRLAAPDLR